MQHFSLPCCVGKTIESTLRTFRSHAQEVHEEKPSAEDYLH